MVIRVDYLEANGLSRDLFDSREVKCAISALETLSPCLIGGYLLTTANDLINVSEDSKQRYQIE